MEYQECSYVLNYAVHKLNFLEIDIRPTSENAGDPPVTHWRPIVLMFQYIFLEIAGTAMEKMEQVLTFFHVCHGFQVHQNQLKCIVSIKEFNVVSGSTTQENYMETRDVGTEGPEGPCPLIFNKPFKSAHVNPKIIHYG